MQSTLSRSLTILLSVVIVLSVNLGAEANSLISSKVFNYQGVIPIKDERSDQVIKVDSNKTEEIPEGMAEAELACWTLINEKSAVTFALQNKVLDELNADLNKLAVDKHTRDIIDSISSRMRDNMNDALNALKRNAADEYFDSLFEASEDIIQLSSVLRDPKLPEDIFLAMVKAVSRMGRNNSALIQEFSDMCSFLHRSPKPRLTNFKLSF